MKANTKQTSKTSDKSLKKEATSKTVPIRFNAEELAACEYLEKASKRKFSGALKWAAIEKAEALGYKPKKK
jgi:hypothetical protein